MEYSLFASLLLHIIFLNPTTLNAIDRKPLIVVTWDYEEAAVAGWKVLHNDRGSALDAVEQACAACEETTCYGTCGFGDICDEKGEITLDSVIMDGQTMDVGAVGALKNISNAVGVARKVMEHSLHSLLAGEAAREFAVKMGFTIETPPTFPLDIWVENNCQPNFWKNVEPDPKTSCGPYTPIDVKNSSKGKENLSIGNEVNHGTKGTTASSKRVGNLSGNERNHDTVGVIALDIHGHIAAASSTNGLDLKMSGRVGPAAISGAGAYADDEVGAAADTGDGDIMMRFLPSFLAVEEMRRGAHPQNATDTVIKRIIKRNPEFFGAVIALDKHGNYGVSCYNMSWFICYVANEEKKNLCHL